MFQLFLGRSSSDCLSLYVIPFHHFTKLPLLITKLDLSFKNRWFIGIILTDLLLNVTWQIFSGAFLLILDGS